MANTITDDKLPNDPRQTSFVIDRRQFENDRYIALSEKGALPKRFNDKKLDFAYPQVADNAPREDLDVVRVTNKMTDDATLIWVEGVGWMQRAYVESFPTELIEADTKIVNAIKEQQQLAQNNPHAIDAQNRAAEALRASTEQGFAATSTPSGTANPSSFSKAGEESEQRAQNGVETFGGTSDETSSDKSILDHGIDAVKDKLGIRSKSNANTSSK